MLSRIFPHLAILVALAIAQPLYQLIGDHPGFLAAHHFGVPGLLLLTSGLSLGLPLLAWVVYRAMQRLNPHAGKAMLGLLLGLLFTLILLPIFGHHATGIYALRAVWVLVLSVLGGLALTVLYFRSELFRLFLTVFSLAAIVFPLNFLFFSPANQLMTSGPSGLGGDRVRLERKPPVIFLLFDELPLVSLLDSQGRIDAGRFPNLAALQRDSVWFPQHTVNSNSTLISVPSMLSGHLPFTTYQGLPRLDNYPDNLFVLLGNHYDMNAWEHGSQLCPVEFCGEYEPPEIAGFLTDLWIILQHLWAPPEWSGRLPAIDNDWMGFGIAAADRQGLKEQIASFKAQLGWNRRVDEFNEFLLSIGDYPDGFHYFHAMLPHGAWQYLPDGRLLTLDPAARPTGIRTGETPEGEKHVWYTHPDAARLSRQAHILQVGFVDHLVGEVVSRLRDLGMYERSLLLLTSDHGAAFQPGHSRRSMRPALLPETAGTPLIIKFPHSEFAQVSPLASQGIDVLPTLLGALGARGWSDFEGVDLMANPDITRRPVRLFGENSRSVEMEQAEYRSLMNRVTGDYAARDGQHDFESLYRSGDYRGWTGTSPDADASPALVGSKVTWDAPELVSNNQPDAPVLQLIVGGTLSGGDFGGRELAISVNGVIQGVSRVFDFPGHENRFEVLLPPEAFTSNPDQVVAWLVTPGPDGPGLTAISSEAMRRFEMHSRDAMTLLRMEGNEFQVEHGVVPGWCTARKGKSEGLWIIGGWAASLAEREPAEALLLFVNGEFVLSRAPGKDTETVAKRFDMPEIRRSAFDLPLVVPPGQALDQIEVRVFALSHSGRVSEINYPRDPALWPFKPNPKPTGPAILPYD